MSSILAKTPDYSPWFSAKNENFDFGQKGYYLKEHLKRSRMVQNSASQHLPVRRYQGAKNELNFGKNA